MYQERVHPAFLTTNQESIGPFRSEKLPYNLHNLGIHYQEHGIKIHLPLSRYLSQLISEKILFTTLIQGWRPEPLDPEYLPNELPAHLKEQIEKNKNDGNEALVS